MWMLRYGDWGNVGNCKNQIIVDDSLFYNLLFKNVINVISLLDYFLYEILNY